MKIIFAGAIPHIEKLAEFKVNYMSTIAYTGTYTKFFSLVKAPYYLIIDSGAFTFQSKGGIDIDAWITRAKKAEKFATEIVSLDVLGDAKKTWENYQYIKKAIPKVIPTFHYGEEFSYLYKYLDITDRIAIGGLVPLKGTPEIKNFLNKIFASLSSKTLPKLHCFGVADFELLIKYPFYSADSTSYLAGEQFAQVETFNGFNKQRMKTNSKVLSFSGLLMSLPNKDNYKIRTKFMVNTFIKMETFLTRVWKERGIQWD